MEQSREPRGKKNPTKHTQLIFDKGAKAIQWNKDTFQMVLEQLNIHMQTKMNLDTDRTLFTKINSKWVRPKYKIQNYKTPRG